MELKEALEKKKKELGDEFEDNRKKATFFIEKRNEIIEKSKQVEGSLEILVGKGSLIAAKIQAINEMLKE